ncbi:hypothetical protein KSS87_000066 [Heliosperma pusillum]|nr:hypothetical protein KSS87_000066 [Heliosperma pusillum]
MKVFFFALLVLVAFITFHGISVVVARNPSFDAIYQFGDSISDTGNDVSLSGNRGCGKLPYGETFYRHPTGRCSDGLLIVDYFVAGATAITTSKTSLLNQLVWFKSLLPKICPNQGGFDKDGIHKACCGTGNNEFNFDRRHSCGSSGVTSCPNPHLRVSWDGIHLTQHAYQVMADQILRQVLPALS